MIKKIFFVLMLIVILTGCSQYSKYYGHNDYDEAYRSGDEGVVVSFLNEDFVYYNGDYLNLQLLFQNKGAYDYPEGKVVLSGYDSSVIKISDEEISLPDEFYGKSAFNEEGSMYFVTAEEDGPLSLKLGETYEASLQASICYSYQTIATTPVCLLYNPEDTFICEQDTISLSDQGAPVAVTEIEQAYMQDQVRFTVTIDHVGEGKVINAYDTNAFDACPFTLTKADLGYVAVDMEINGLGEPTCVPYNKYVKLNDDGEGLIVCTFTLREQRSFVTPLQITLDYSYLDTVEQDVGVVERTGERSAVDFGSSSSPSGSSSSGSSGDCYCSQANMNIWGGCVCLYINGKENYCLEGSSKIPVSASAGDTIEYVVKGSSTVNMCGDTSSPSTSCPFTGKTTVPKKLSIYGTTIDGRTVSERCNLVIK